MRYYRSFTIFTMCVASVQAYQPQEFFFQEHKQTTISETVVSVNGEGQFKKEVIQNKKPVILHVFSSKHATYKAFAPTYQRVAEAVKGSVVCALLDIESNQSVMQFIMMKLGIRKIGLPLFFFFKDGALLLPVITGVTSFNELGTMIVKRFSLSEQSITSETNVQQGDVDQKEKTLWERLRNLGEKLQRWFSSFNVFTKLFNA